MDNDQGAPAYTETGTWATSSSSGYGGKTYRYAYTTTTETATATFRPQIPQSGMYPVYVYYRDSSNRPVDGLFRVQHTGGTTDIRIDQTKNGLRWLFLGEFYFEKGNSGAVILSNSSPTLDKALIADAVRFGGGVGPSGHPRWKEGAKVWIPYVGAPLSAYGEVTIRGEYADWQGGDAYLSIHTNAGGGQGTSSFIHDTNPSPGSVQYRATVHDQIVKDIRSMTGSGWIDRGKKTANFGELRATNNMPHMLVELAFHDHVDDAKWLQNQKFRDLLGRAMYKGLSRYLASSSQVSPLAPTHLVVKNSGSGEVTLSWKSQADPLESQAVATSYIVYVSNNGYGFDNGVEVSGTSLAIKNLTPEALYFFRVTAVNSAGESLPSETMAVRVTPKGEAPKIIIVSGYDRMDRLSTHNKREVNERNYTVQHAWSLARAGYFFDSASNEAIENSAVFLKDYKIADWILGEESTIDETFSAVEQSLVKDFLNDGGSLMVSGSEIGWDLGAKGSVSDQAFLRDYLHVQYVKDSAGTYSVKSDANGAFAGLASFSFDNSTAGTYDVDFADVVAPEGGAKVALTFSTGEGAAIQYGGVYKVLFLSFPIETITSESARDGLMTKTIEFLK